MEEGKIYKECKKCGTIKWIKERCKVCTYKYGRERYQKNKEKFAKKYLENKEDFIKKRVEYYQNNKEKISKTLARNYQRNKEKRIKKSNEYYQNNKIEVYKFMKAHYKKTALYKSSLKLKFGIIEEIRRDPQNESLLQVRCIYCGQWFNPTNRAVVERTAYINGTMPTESRFYCSYGCKRGCPIFRASEFPRRFRQATANEVQPELRKMVFARDNWLCLRCGIGDNLRCHHIDPIKSNPIESADIDNCMTLCKGCHKEAHKDKGCRYIDLARC